jgi:hypothetical protein
MDRLGLSVFYFTLRPNAAIFLQWVSPTYIGFDDELHFLLAAITKKQKLVNKIRFNLRLFMEAYSSLKQFAKIILSPFLQCKYTSNSLTG